MNIFGSNSEYAKLSSILLHKPGIEICNNPDPLQILHLRPIDHHTLALEFDAAAAVFKLLGIEVNLIDSTPLDDDTRYLFNLMYCRDLFFMTPEGAILSNMANDIRRREPDYAERTLMNLGVPLLHTVSGAGRFEGADALWLRSDLVVVGVGNRTNLEGYQQLNCVLKQQGVKCVALPSTQIATQHLLGSVQIVDSDLAFVRNEIVAPEIISFLMREGFAVVNIPENIEVKSRQAMNVVTVSPRTVVMTAGCPKTRAMYVSSGVAIAAELALTQLINGAGGLACATAILGREI